MALGCRYILALSQRAHLVRLDGDPWQKDMRAAAARTGWALLPLLGQIQLSDGLQVRNAGQSLDRHHEKGVWPPPVIITTRPPSLSELLQEPACVHNGVTVRGKKREEENG